MRNHGNFLSILRLATALVAAFLVSAPLHAQVKFKYGLVQSKADAPASSGWPRKRAFSRSAG